MKNLVAKTIVITLSAIVCVMTITFGALCVFTPKTVARFFNDVGNYPASVFFYELQFEQSNSLDDLAILADNAYSNKDEQGHIKYLSKLVYSKSFVQYCNKKDADSSSNMSYKEYYTGRLASAYLGSGNFNKALSLSKSFVGAFGYSQFNPMRKLVEYKDGLTAQNRTQLKQALLSLDTASLNAEQLGFLNLDISKLA